jgi:hypothetical protein
MTLFWPGEDYPDREIWLAKRANLTFAQLCRSRGRVLYEVKRGGKPLAMGVNATKRVLDGGPDGRRELLAQRREYYQRTSLAQ